MNNLATQLEREDTLPPGSGLHPVSAIDAGARPIAWAKASVIDGKVVVPGGFACDVPEAGRVITVPMDQGWLVHVESVAGDPDGDVLVSVEPPATVDAPADDATLARLAIESREGATGDDDIDSLFEPTRALRRAWSYRRAFERLAEAWPGEGGPVVPVRWLTVSYEGRVHVAGVGTVDATADARHIAADGRAIHVRRVADGDPWAPAGAVEVVVCPKPPDEDRPLEEITRPVRITTSPKVVRLAG